MKQKLLPLLGSLCLASLFITCKNESKGKDDGSIRNILLKQLKTTHTVKEWFVPVNLALEGLSAEQAMWHDSSGNHSVGQLAHHLAFWNERALRQFLGEKVEEFSGNNEETFNAFTKESWAKTVSKLDSVLTQIEHTVESADEGKLKEWYSTVANISAHNAYHTGQIIFIRKQQGSWDPEKGVK
jgi:uncharacterized damage-inducible protein DinB